jgi:hypothetical protein
MVVQFCGGRRSAIAAPKARSVLMACFYGAFDSREVAVLPSFRPEAGLQSFCDGSLGRKTVCSYSTQLSDIFVWSINAALQR